MVGGVYDHVWAVCSNAASSSGKALNRLGLARLYCQLQHCSDNACFRSSGNSSKSAAVISSTTRSSRIDGALCSNRLRCSFR